MVDYISLANIATTQILDKGRVVTYKASELPEYNPTLDEVQGSIETSHDISGVFLAYAITSIDGTLVKNGDKRLLIAGDQVFEPKANDKIIDGENIYNVISVRIVAPGNTTMLYELQIRR